MIFRSIKDVILHPVTRRVFRVTRVGVLSGGLVYSGYLLGSLTVLKDPKRFELEYLQQALAKHAKAHSTTHFATIRESWRPSRNPGLMAVDDWVSEIGFSEDALRTPRTAASDLEGGDNLAEDLERIYRVGKRVLNASRKLVAGRLDEQRQAAETGESVIDFTALDMDQMQLEEAERLLTLEEWKFTYLHSDDVDCFVNHYAPRRIFITKGMIDLCRKCKTDAPLAMAIGHELSHTILNHGENDEWLDVGLKIGQLMVLSLLDPTGLLTLGLEASLVFTSPLARTHYSKEQTSTADGLSLKICAEACYRPDDAIKYLTLLGFNDKERAAELTAHPTTADVAPAPTAEVSLAAAAPPAPGVTANAAPQPSQVGFGDSMLQRLLAMTAEQRSQNVQQAMPIAHDVYDSNGCATWRRAADEFLSDLRDREKQRVRYTLEDVGRVVGYDPIEDDGTRLLSAADVGGIVVGSATIATASVLALLSSLLK